MPKPAQGQARVVLVSQRRPDSAARDNARLLAEFVPGVALVTLPWEGGTDLAKPSRRAAVALKPLLDALVQR